MSLEIYAESSAQQNGYIHKTYYGGMDITIIKNIFKNCKLASRAYT